jgi:methionyl-tRNA synthetase
VWSKIASANAYINEREPWKQTGEGQARTLAVTATMIAHVAWLLQPFMPATAQTIARRLGVPLSQWSDGQAIAVAAGEPLFPRRS